MSVLVLLEVNATKPDELEAFFREELHHTRAFEGCEGLTIHRNMDDSNNLVIVENWETREHYEKYFKWREDRGDLDKLGPMSAGPPSIRFFTIVGV